MRAFILSGLLGLLVATSAAAGSVASGTFSFRDVEYTVVDAVAWNTGGEYPMAHVAVSDHPFDPAAIAADGVFNDADLMPHPGASLMITYLPDEQEVFGIRLRNETGHGADFRCEGSGLLSLSAVDAETVAGRFDCEEHRVSFEAPVLATPGE